MRICVVTNRTENVRWFREDLISDLSSKGHDVIVLGEADPIDWNGYFRELGARYLSYPVVRSGLNPVEELATLRHLVRLFSRERPDVVFTYQAKANTYGCLAAAKANVPKIFASVEGLGTLSDEADLKRRAVNFALRRLYKPALAAASKVFFINNDDVDYFVSHGLVDQKKIVMTNGVGVNTEKFSFTEMPSGKPRFLFMGRLVVAKGIREFIQAARILKDKGVDAEFHILGGLDTSSDAISGSELNSWINEGCVIYDGAVEDVRPFLQRCTALVSPSYREGVPKSAMEAMAIGRPIVASDITGFRIVVDDGITGILVPVRDARSLADCMKVIADHSDLAESMGLAARQKAEREFDVRQVNQIVCEVIGA